MIFAVWFLSFSFLFLRFDCPHQSYQNQLFETNTETASPRSSVRSSMIIRYVSQMIESSLSFFFFFRVGGTILILRSGFFHSLLVSSFRLSSPSSSVRSSMIIICITDDREFFVFLFLSWRHHFDFWRRSGFFHSLLVSFVCFFVCLFVHLFVSLSLSLSLFLSLVCVNVVLQ